MHLEQPRRRRPQFRKWQEDVSVAGRLAEHEEDACAQPLRLVELDAKRPRDAVGHAEPDPRQLGQPVRIVLEHGDHIHPVGAHEARGETCADPVREEERFDLTDGGNLAPRRDRPLDCAARDRAAAFVRTSRSRSGSRSSSAKTCSAPKWSTIARANVGPMPGTRAAARARLPPPSAAGPSGRTRRRTASRNARAARPRRRQRCSRPLRRGREGRAA